MSQEEPMEIDEEEEFVFSCVKLKHLEAQCEPTLTETIKRYKKCQEEKTEFIPNSILEQYVKMFASGTFKQPLDPHDMLLLEIISKRLGGGIEEKFECTKISAAELEAIKRYKEHGPEMVTESYLEDEIVWLGGGGRSQGVGLYLRTREALLLEMLKREF